MVDWTVKLEFAIISSSGTCTCNPRVKGLDGKESIRVPYSLIRLCVKAFEGKDSKGHLVEQCLVRGVEEDTLHGAELSVPIIITILRGLEK